MSNRFSRRTFLAAMLVAGAPSWEAHSSGVAPLRRGGPDDKPALLGGTPVRTRPFPSWPVVEEEEHQALRQVLESRHWNRGAVVEQFEEAWKERLGARHVVATASGTAALYTSLFALGVGPGDEVIVPPYTFVATVNVVLLHHALPVFVDTDRQTFQMDPDKIEGAATGRTRCIVPVHLGGNVAEMDKIRRLAAGRGIAVLEDACQAHLAEWRGQKVGTWGDLGCFSFQASKNLNSGEGGAISGNDPGLMETCASFQNAGRPYRVDEQGRLGADRDSGFAYARNGDNRRMTEFQGALLLAQLKRLEDQSRIREENARYLSTQLEQVPGISPARMYEGCTRNAYHLFMFRYDSRFFADLPRSRFLEALRAEGIPCSGGYRPLNREPFLKEILASRPFRRIYSSRELSQWEERNLCPENDRLCAEAVWLSQTQLLGPRTDMDDIVAAVAKIQKQASLLKTA